MPQRTPDRQLGSGDHPAVHGPGCLLARQAGDAGTGKHYLKDRSDSQTMLINLGNIVFR